MKLNFRSISEALSAKFVFSGELAQVLSMALAHEMNVLLWGPGGHGKSEMVQTALEAVGLWESAFVQSFGEGMDEARLYGGIDLRALEDERVMRFCNKRSFLEAPVAVFEELFDAPKSVLLSLKDTLTRHELRNGDQRVPMKTKTIIACTNRDPREFAGDDLAYLALLERFPLQFQVTWKNYDTTTFGALYEKLAPQEINYRPAFCRVMAQIMADLSEPPRYVSPRMAVQSMNAIFAFAKLRGYADDKTALGKIKLRDFYAIRFVQGFEHLRLSLNDTIDRAIDFNGPEYALTDINSKLTEVLRRLPTKD